MIFAVRPRRRLAGRPRYLPLCRLLVPPGHGGGQRGPPGPNPPRGPPAALGFFMRHWLLMVNRFVHDPDPHLPFHDLTKVAA